MLGSVIKKGPGSPSVLCMHIGENGLGPTRICTGPGPTGIYTGMGPTVSYTGPGPTTF